MTRHHSRTLLEFVCMIEANLASMLGVGTLKRRNMSDKKSITRRKNYRQEIGRQFASKFNLSIGNGPTADEVPVLYQTGRHAGISSEIQRMNPRTLARIIETTPSPNDGKTVHLLLPRKGVGGLESLNCVGLSGRQYLEILAHCAIVGAIFEYLRGLQNEQAKQIEIVVEDGFFGAEAWDRKEL